MTLEATVRKLAIGASLVASALLSPALNAQQPARVTAVDSRYADDLHDTRWRTDTRFIIMHATDASFSSSLNTLAGKHETNYLVNRDGHIYEIVERNHLAHHAGNSMWNGLRNISDHSVGIELVGPGDGPFTNNQYRSTRTLVKQLQAIYNIPDSRVLAHYQVACCRPNGFQTDENKRLGLPKHMPHRGGRLDAALDWNKLGIHHRTDDPDVAAGRLHLNHALGNWMALHRYSPAAKRSFVISKANTAWAIAGDMYDEQTTLYNFPDGSVHLGSTITHWDAIPLGTRVRLNATVPRPPFVRMIHRGETAWDVAGRQFNDSTTFYIMPDHSVQRGDTIDEAHISPGTLAAVGARGPYVLSKGKSAWSIAGHVYNTDSAAYITKDGVILGNATRNFERMAPGTLVLLRNP